MLYMHGKKKGECNTSKIIKEAQKEADKLEKMIDKIERFLGHAPEGCLKYQNKGKRTYFYHQYMNEKTKRWSRKYIKKENISLARELAQKHYYAAIRPVLERNLEVLKNFIKQYQVQELEKVYNGLSNERKNLIAPLLNSKEERIRQWKEEQYEKNNSYAENLRYETEQGDFVRSKSEVIIANILYHHRNDIWYKYERPLDVLIDGKIRTIYPDFTIINIHMGRMIYWEHAGRMDDPHYANDFVKKVNIYISNNLLPGRDVFFTYESQSNSLEISVIKKLVENILE